MNSSQLGNPNTASETLFEQYLKAHGYAGWTHESPIKGKPTTPDFRLRHAGVESFFEVKEFDAPLRFSPGFRTYDLYGPVREKVNRAARQFKHYKEYSCSVVLSNPNDAFVDLDSPDIILGTMLGDLGFQIQLGVPPGPDNPPIQVFVKNGKMVNDKGQSPQNTTISAVIVLSRYPLRRKRIAIVQHERCRKMGRGLTGDELVAISGACPISEESQPIRVAVYENPFARFPLNRDLFHGPFDEWWGPEGEYMRRIFVGDDLRCVEEELARHDQHF